MRVKLRWAQVRDGLLFMGGFAMAWYEVLLPEPRALILALAGGMMGLPAAIFADKKFVIPGLGSAGSPDPAEPPPDGPAK